MGYPPVSFVPMQAVLVNMMLGAVELEPEVEPVLELGVVVVVVEVGVAISVEV
jgi:hypothetical protein